MQIYFQSVTVSKSDKNLMGWNIGGKKEKKKEEK